MKSLKNLALIFAAAFITLGANAQAATTKPADKTATQTSTPVTKDKTKTKEKANGTTKTTTKSKPTKKVDASTTK